METEPSLFWGGLGTSANQHTLVIHSLSLSLSPSIYLFIYIYILNAYAHTCPHSIPFFCRGFSEGLPQQAQSFGCNSGIELGLGPSTAWTWSPLSHHPCEEAMQEDRPMAHRWGTESTVPATMLGSRTRMYICPKKKWQHPKRISANTAWPGGGDVYDPFGEKMLMSSTISVSTI